MKKNLWAVGALVFAIAFSSFTTPFALTKYFVFNGGATQKLRSAYTETSLTQSPIAGANNVLAWIKIVEDDGVISDSDFYAAFEMHDQNATSSDLLNDEEEQTLVDDEVRTVTIELKP